MSASIHRRAQPASRSRCLPILLALAAAAVPPVLRAQQPVSAAAPLSADPQLGAITGLITARDLSPLQGVPVQISGGSPAISRTATTDQQGTYSFTAIPPGSYTLTVASSGFATVQAPFVLVPSGRLSLPPIALAMATAVSDIRVSVTERELATEELKEEETQRVFGVIPNFLVSYDYHPAPLSTRQKFQLSWRAVVDPVNIGITAGVAGVQQADNAFSGYGQGAAGYFKRFGAGYTDLVAGTLLSSAILPSLLHQDPRYLVRSTGSPTRRILYAISATVICRGDNGRWEPNYSNIGGSLGAGALSNLYYPASDRSGVSLTVQNTLIGFAFGAADNLFEEFLVRKLTPHPPPEVGAAEAESR